MKEKLENHKRSVKVALLTGFILGLIILVEFYLVFVVIAPYNEISPILITVIPPINIIILLLMIPAVVVGSVISFYYNSDLHSKKLVLLYLICTMIIIIIIELDAYVFTIASSTNYGSSLGSLLFFGPSVVALLIFLFFNKHLSKEFKGFIIYFIIMPMFIFFIASGCIGVAGGGPPIGCAPIAGYLCQNPTMSTSGTLNFVLGNVNNNTEYNIMLACASYNNSNTPFSLGIANVWYQIDSNGSAINYYNSNAHATNTLNLSNRQQVTITGLQCYQLLGAFNPKNIGTYYAGVIWLNYTTTPNITQGNWHIIKLGNIYEFTT